MGIVTQLYVKITLFRLIGYFRFFSALLTSICYYSAVGLCLEIILF